MDKFFFSSRRRHTRSKRDWSSDVCSSDLLEIPDPELTFFEETEHWEFGEIDWNEFWNVVKGNGPMNRHRMKARRKAHAEGQWVRDAAEEYARKKKLSEEKAS